MQTHASRVYVGLRFLTSLANATMFTTYAIYYIAALGLDPLQLLLVGTVLELTVLVFEGITGVVADTYSRRLSVILGTFLLGIGFLFEGSAPWAFDWLGGALSLFVIVLIAEVVRGIGETFLSGATSAWVTDEVGEDKVGQIFLRAGKWAQYASLLGIGASVGLSTIAANLPYVAGGVLYLLIGVWLLLVMRETNFVPQREEDGSPLRDMANTWKSGLRTVRGNGVLMLILITTLFGGAASEGFDRLWEAHLISSFTFPDWEGMTLAAWFGLLAVAGTVLSILAMSQLEKRLDMRRERTVATALLVFTALRVLLVTAFALSPDLWSALASFLALGVVRTLTYPVYDTWLNSNIESRVRATVLSMMSQSDALGQTAGGPFVGWVGVRTSVRTSLVLAALLLAPLLIAYQKARKKHAA